MSSWSEDLELRLDEAECLETSTTSTKTSGLLNTSLWVKEFRLSTPAFAFYLLRELNLGSFNAGSAVPTLNRNHVHGLPTVLPPSELIRAFDSSAGPLLKRQHGLQAESQALTEIRDALLSKLISGEIRVDDAERFTRNMA